jgi:transcriptional regulator with XRE-family HTH domain
MHTTAMDQNKHQHPNALVIYRHRMRFTQKRVAQLLGMRSTCMLSRYERARSLPPLKTALRLGIILRVPIEFLFPGIYENLRNEIREAEENLARPVQQALFKNN